MTVRAVSSNPTSPFYNANAPALSGSAGALTTVLDGVLVNGFTGFTALGWSINQTTTNKRGYKQNLTGANNSSGMCLYVDDTGPGAGGAREARACGFETMSAITPTGTGQFPTGAQSAIGTGQVVIRKSTTADATARYYTIVGNGQTFYLFVESGDNTTMLATCSFCFGDFKSFKTSDQYAVFIIGRMVENSGSGSCEPLVMTSNPNNAGTNVNGLVITLFGHFVARSWTGTGGSVKVGKPNPTTIFNSGGQYAGCYTGETQLQVSQGLGGSPLVCLGRYAHPYSWPAPNGPDGALALMPVYLAHNYAMRGYLPGLWHPLHDRPLGHNDNFTVSGGNLNGKSLLAQNVQSFINQLANTENGLVIVETSDTWT